jgi:hypothetical protein
MPKQAPIHIADRRRVHQIIPIVSSITSDFTLATAAPPIGPRIRGCFAVAFGVKVRVESLTDWLSSHGLAFGVKEKRSVCCRFDRLFSRLAAG